MFEKRFMLNEKTMHIVEDIGDHMPGGFFIYKAAQPEELLYVNKTVLDIFGCRNMDEFREHTGNTFKGMLHPFDYDKISKSIDEQIGSNDDRFDHVEYRIIRRDGETRWVDDYGHYTDNDEYGGIYYVFISDITEKKEAQDRLQAELTQIMAALSSDLRCVYHIDLDKDEGICYKTDTPYMNALRVGENFSLSEMAASYASKFVDTEYREGFMKFVDPENIRAGLESESVISYRYQIHRNGKDSYEMLRMAPMGDPFGRGDNTVHAVGMGLSDIDKEMRDSITLAAKDSK